MGLKFFVDRDDTEIKHFKITGIDTETGEPATEEHWIELRRDLSDLEWSELEMGIADRINNDGEIVLNFAGLSTKQLLTWVKSWSFYMGGNPNNRVKPTAEFLGRLDRDIANQVREIIREHTEERRAAKEAAADPTATTRANGVSATSEATSAPATRRVRGTSSPSHTDSETPESA